VDTVSRSNRMTKSSVSSTRNARHTFAHAKRALPVGYECGLRVDTWRDLLSKNVFAIAALNAILNTAKHQVLELAL
jgi:hypothetical protein